VLPQVASRTARGQLWAAIDVLRNLSARIEPARAPFEEEARSAEGALRGLAAQAPDALAREIAARLDALPDDAAVRVDAWRTLLRDVCERLEALRAERATALRALLGGHLAGQVIRDLSRFQGSLLDEISKG